MAERGIIFRFFGDTTSLTAATAKAEGSMATLGTTGTVTGNKMFAAGNRMTSIGTSLSLLTVPLVIAAGATIKLGTDYDASTTYAAGDYVGVWFRRVVPSSQSYSSGNEWSYLIEGDDA